MLIKLRLSPSECVFKNELIRNLSNIVQHLCKMDMIYLIFTCFSRVSADHHFLIKFMLEVSDRKSALKPVALQDTRTASKY